MTIIGFALFVALVAILFYSPKIRQFIRLCKFAASVPGPTLRQQFQSSGNFLTWLSQLSAQYGQVFRLGLLKIWEVNFCHPDDIQQILTNTKLYNKSDDYKMMMPWLGNSILINGGEAWHRRRKLLTPAFHFRILSEFEEPMNENCRILVSRLRQHLDGKSFDVYPYLTLFGLDVISETAMGIKQNAQMESSSEYVQAVQTICKLFDKRMHSIWEKFNVFQNFTKSGREMSKTLKVLHGETDRVIKLRRQILQESNIHKMAEAEKLTNDIGTKRRYAFLDMLLLGQMQGNGLTDVEIREEVSTFMFAGQDTTSSTLGFALYILSQHAEVQQKAFEEAKAMEGKERENMPYLVAVIKETLRMYPAVALVSRKVLEDVQIGKYLVPRGASIGVVPYVTHRNKEYFPQPEIFKPERFLPENASAIHPFSFLPFIAGQRNCMGQKYAMLELKCCLSHLLRHFEFLPVANFKPQPVPRLVTKSANGIQVKIKLRR